MTDSLIPHQELVPYFDTILIPSNWRRAGRVLCIPGSNNVNYAGPAALALTDDLLALCTPEGAIVKVTLWSIEEVRIVRFEGIILELPTSYGIALGTPRDNFGIEVIFNRGAQVKGRIKFMTIYADVANDWQQQIEEAAFKHQSAGVKRMLSNPPASE